MSFMQKMIVETQMPITPKHAFKEKSTKLLTLLSLRTIYNRTFQCETPCITLYRCTQVSKANARPEERRRTVDGPGFELLYPLPRDI